MREEASVSINHRLEFTLHQNSQILKAGGVDFEDKRLTFEEWGKVINVVLFHTIIKTLTWTKSALSKTSYPTWRWKPTRIQHHHSWLALCRSSPMAALRSGRAGMLANMFASMCICLNIAPNSAVQTYAAHVALPSTCATPQAAAIDAMFQVHPFCLSWQASAFWIEPKYLPLTLWP